MGNGDNVSLGSLTAKGLGFLSAKLDSAIDKANSSATETKGNWCAKCGRRLNAETRYCPSCGEPTAQVKLSPPQGMPVVPQDSSSLNGRRQAYVGAIQKCPNCGGPVDATDAVCDSCGFHIIGRDACDSVRAFHLELAEIERTRKRRGVFSTEILDATDKRIITLVNTFPIPNTIEDISDFMFMAVHNINVSASKKTLLNKFQETPEKAISDAWVAKTKQVYSKAKMAFPDDPIFAQIEALYLEKMAELKMPA